MAAQSWLWPDHVIGKRESRRLRNEHNALVNDADKLRLLAGKRREKGDRLAEAARDLITQFVTYVNSDDAELPDPSDLERALKTYGN